MSPPLTAPTLRLVEALATRGHWGHTGSPSPTACSGPRLRVAIVHTDRAEAEAAALEHGWPLRVRPTHEDRPATYNVEAYGNRALAATTAALEHLDEVQRAAVVVVLDEVDRRREARNAARRA